MVFTPQSNISILYVAVCKYFLGWPVYIRFYSAFSICLLMVCDSFTGHRVLIKRVFLVSFAHRDLGCILPLRDETVVKIEACLQHSCYNGKAENKVSLSQQSDLEGIQIKSCYAARHITTSRGDSSIIILINASYCNVSLYYICLCNFQNMHTQTGSCQGGLYNTQKKLSVTFSFLAAGVFST